MTEREATLCLVIENRVADLSAAQAPVMAFLQAWQIDPDDTVQVMIILDEIASNIIRAAWPQGGQHHFGIAFAVEPADAALRLVLRVTDDGVPFDPTLGPPPDTELSLDERQPGGLGRFLVKTMSDSVEYSRVAGLNRLQVTKTLRRAGSPL